MVRTLGYFLICVLLFAEIGVADVCAAPAPYSSEAHCGANAPRPDRGGALREQIVNTPAGSIGYYRFGSGSPIVLITGYRARMAEWNAYFLGELAKYHDVVVFDNRGIGRSETASTSYRINDLADDAAALIEALNLTGATVVGWSMGGMIAQQLVVDHPGLVGKLVLIGSMPPGRQSVSASAQVERILSGGGGGQFNKIMSVLFPVEAVQEAQKCFASGMFSPDSYARPRIPNSVAQAQRILIKYWKLDDNILERLRSVGVPVLVLTGTEDKVVPPINSILLSKILLHAKLVEIERGGHAVMYQYPREVARYIDLFDAR